MPLTWAIEPVPLCFTNEFCHSCATLVTNQVFERGPPGKRLANGDKSEEWGRAKVDRMRWLDRWFGSQRGVRWCPVWGHMTQEPLFKNWSIVDLQCCVTFWCTGKWLSYITIYCEVKMKVDQLCPTLCNPRDCSSLGSSVLRILQARIWSGLPCPSPGELPDPGRDQTQVSCVTGRFFTTWATREALYTILYFN